MIGLLHLSLQAVSRNPSGCLHSLHRLCAKKHPAAYFHAQWPTYDESKLSSDIVELPVQIMGKVRGKIQVPNNASIEDIEQKALNHPHIASLIEGKTIRKVIVIQNQIINIVAN